MSNTQKTVLITGATAGIGRMTALHLTKLGHHVIASGRKVSELAKLKDEAASLGKLDTLHDEGGRRATGRRQYRTGQRPRARPASGAAP